MSELTKSREVPCWAEYFIGMARYVRTKSKDRSTQVGVVVVGPDNEVRSTGYNGFCRGINDEIQERHERPVKYQWTEHGERNSIYNAARAGIKTIGCTMYFHGRPWPCSDCARAVIQSGIIRVVGQDISFEGKGKNGWTQECEVGRKMLTEAGVEIVLLDYNYEVKMVTNARSDNESFEQKCCN